MALVNDCCCGSRCSLGGRCDSQHKCIRCERHLHAICGVFADETDPKWSICYSRICFNCHERSTNNNDDSSADDDLPIAALGRKRAAAAAAAPAPKEAPPKKKKKKRAPRPDVVYLEDPAADPTSWVFPADRPEYLPAFLELMSFIDNKKYTKSSTFTKEQVMKLQPRHVLAFLTHKAFGKTRRLPEDRPDYARSNHIKNMKMKLSHYMPSSSPWVELPNGEGHGNPTRHKSINKLIEDITKFEVRGEGSEGRDVRDMEMVELEKELELLRQSKDPTCRYRNPLMALYQVQFITRSDDVINFKVEDPKGNSIYEMALSQSVKWSKNVKDNRNCPDQLLLAAKDHRYCLFLGLALWLEYFLHDHPNATFMMSPGLPRDNTPDEHKKFTQAIKRTYRNQWEREVLKKPEFKGLYKGSDKRKLGLHSKRKTGSTQAKRRGASGDQVDHRGRWVMKKGSRIVNQVYINPEDVFADAFVASLLAIGGPIKYKVKAAVGNHISTQWLADNVVVNIAKRWPEDEGLLRNLGLALLWLAHDEQARDDLDMPAELRTRIQDAYKDLCIDNKPAQPVDKISLHIYRHGEVTVIEEILPQQQQQQQQQNNTATNVGDELARMPASGSEGATQHVLQTLVIQQRQLQQQLQELQQSMLTMDQRNRAWTENKFRVINDNIRRFGGTIRSGLARQDPERQAEVQRYNQEDHGRHNDLLYPTNYTRRARQWPKLAPNIRDLMVLWNEWEYGVGGRKPAKDWTAQERGGGGDKKVKQMYHRRKNIWRIQLLLINKGRSIQSANALIERTYGARLSLTAISQAIARDRQTYKDDGGLHPNFR